MTLNNFMIIYIPTVIVFAVIIIALMRRQANMISVWAKDWKNARDTVQKVNAENKKQVSDYNEHVSLLVTLSESLAETALLLSRYSDLENEEIAPEDDLYPKGIAAAALLQTIWDEFPKSLIGSLPTTKSFVDAFGVKKSDIDEMAGENQDKPDHFDFH